MSGRIRTIKPEWLEDEGLLRAGSDARVLSVALILIADDYGRGRCIPEVLAGQVFPFDAEPSRACREALARLSRMGFVELYEVRGQQYYGIRNWSKHQRVDKPSNPRVPAPSESNSKGLDGSRDPRETLASPSGDPRETLAPDPDPDPDPEGRGPRARSRAIPPPPTPGAEHRNGKSSPKLTTAGDDVEAGPFRLWAIWELVAGEGSGTCGDRKPHLRALGEVWLACSKRAPSDPDALWRKIVEAYVAEARSRSKRCDLKFLCCDFHGYADQVSRPPSNGPSGAAYEELKFE